MLAACSDEPGVITRTFLQQGTRQSHDLLLTWMQSASLSCRVDDVGNLIGRRRADREDAPILLIGSHIDTVPNGGKYDGAMGVLAALACVQTLGNTPLPFHLDVVAFSEEEGVRFRLPYIGSLAIAGRFDVRWLDRMDDQGITLRESIRRFGLNDQTIDHAAYDPTKLLGYVEMHIEQGILLERMAMPVGVVSAIAGQSRLRLTFKGEARHAGTTPMNLRADALVAAAKVIIAANEYGQTAPDLRVTVGQIINEPNATNVVPGKTQISLDIRHAIDAIRIAAVEDLIAKAKEISTQVRVEMEVTHDLSQSGVAMNATLTTELLTSMKELGLEPNAMLSGAGHDAVALAGVCPTAMLFVRNPGGISHHPEECVHAADIAVAIEVMTRFIGRLASSLLKKDSNS